MSNGKTDKPRPFSVTKEEYEANHARTFGDPREAQIQYWDNHTLWKCRCGRTNYGTESGVGTPRKCACGDCCDTREAMRQANLQEAADTILNAPPASWMPTPTQDT